MDGNFSEDHRVFMRLALDQAMQSAAAEEVPIGAVLVQQGASSPNPTTIGRPGRTLQPMLK